MAAFSYYRLAALGGRQWEGLLFLLEVELRISDAAAKVRGNLERYLERVRIKQFRKVRSDSYKSVCLF